MLKKARSLDHTLRIIKVSLHDRMLPRGSRHIHTTLVVAGGKPTLVGCVVLHLFECRLVRIGSRPAPVNGLGLDPVFLIELERFERCSMRASAHHEMRGIARSGMLHIVPYLSRA